MAITNWMQATASSSTYTSQNTSSSSNGHYMALFQQLLSGSETEAIEGLTDAFETWESTYSTSGISIDRLHDVQETRDEFISLMEKAVNEGGYDDSLAFVKSFSTEELAILQGMQGLVDPINPDTLSEEGALNLLLPPNMKQDVNNDAIVETGLAKGWQFPPVNAPQYVHDAWEDATAHLSASEKMLAQGMFLVVMISANVKTNAEGEPIGIYEPGEDGFTNPFAAEDFSYEDTVRKMIDALNNPERTETAEQLERKRTLLKSFLDGLTMSDS